MRTLSVSAAWDETTAILRREGRLMVSVALAMIALPSALNSFVNPGGVNGASTPIWAVMLALIASLIALAGQLALIRLALGPSITVGGAITHGLKRMPIYFVSAVLIIFGFLLVGIPIGLVLSALGVPITAKPPASPGLTVAVLFYVVLIAFVGVRLLLTAPVASAEAAGPIAIIKRSWLMTNGHWWRLFGFLLAFVVAAIVMLVAISSAAGIVIQLLIGSVQPMSAAALVIALIQALVSAAVTTVFAIMLARIYLQLAGPVDSSETPWR